jgi:hypothetical protein
MRPRDAQTWPICKSCSLMIGARFIPAQILDRSMSSLPSGSRSNCRMFATLQAIISSVTIAPHERQN